MNSKIRSLVKSLRTSLRVKVTLGVVLPLVLILGISLAIDYNRHREMVLSNLSLLASQSSQVIENSLQIEMLSRNLDGLQQMLDAIGEGEAIRVIYLLDTNGRVVFAPKGENVGTILDNRDPNCQPCHQLPAVERPGSVVVTLPDGQRVFRSMNPIENRPACQACHNAEQRLLGLLLTDISMGPLEAPLAADLRRKLLWWAGTILVTVFVVNLAMSRLVIQRLEGLARALAHFGRGRRDLRLPTQGTDEIGQLANAFNQMVRQIETETAENRALSEHLRRQSTQRGELLKRLITAQEDERKRVARELHDELGQTLGGLALQLEAIDQLIATEPDRARERLGQTRTPIAEATEQMYDLILTLRPSALDDLGLVPALRANAERVLENTGIQFDLDAQGLTRRLNSEVETTLFRTFQEALTNIVRHAEARHVRFTLACRDGVFEGEIVDDGRGFDPATVNVADGGPRGLGLLGMQERVAQCSGHLEVTSRPEGGTRIYIRIPLTEVNRG